MIGKANMHYDVDQLHTAAFTATLRLSKALKAVFDLHDMPHVLPVLRSEVIKRVVAFLADDNVAVSLKMKEDALLFHIEEWEKQHDAEDPLPLFDIDALDVDEDDTLLPIADLFAKLVRDHLPTDGAHQKDSKHIGQCLKDMKEHGPDEYARLPYFFFTNPEKMEEEHTLALLADYNLPVDMDVEEIDPLFRLVAQDAFPAFCALWSKTGHPLQPLSDKTNEVIANSRSLLVNMAQALDDALVPPAAPKPRR